MVDLWVIGFMGYWWWLWHLWLWRSCLTNLLRQPFWLFPPLLHVFIVSVIARYNVGISQEDNYLIGKHNSYNNYWQISKGILKIKIPFMELSHIWNNNLKVKSLYCFLAHRQFPTTTGRLRLGRNDGGKVLTIVPCWLSTREPDCGSHQC